MLQAHALVKRYRSRTVVDGVSLEVARGEAVGLLGPNGAGKTTTFYMITGLVRADSGEVVVDGRRLGREPMHVRARHGIGYLPQEPSVFRRLSVADNVLAILETRRDLDRQARLQRRDALLDELHIGHLAGNPALSLSGGERRRLEIARALATEPTFMLLDEPFAGVDPISVLDIQRIIRHLCERGIGVLVTDHNVRETLGICARAYIINAGQVLAEGNAEQILAHEEVREVYLGHDFRL
ncbi:MAG TPA: LPS export ABC transporter ATP-binding protein [Gammaproteobacteria bacterium]